MAAEADLTLTGQEHSAEDRAPRRVVVMKGGPTLVEGPVQLEMDGAEPVVIDRFLVAICACRRSGSYPLCDGTHRRTQRS